MSVRLSRYSYSGIHEMYSKHSALGRTKKRVGANNNENPNSVLRTTKEMENFETRI